MKKQIALFLAISIIFSFTGCAAQSGNQQQSTAELTDNKQATAIAAVKYPKMEQYPDEANYTDKKTGEFDSDGFSEAYQKWWEEKKERQTHSKEETNGLAGFIIKSMPQILSDSHSENTIYSPLNVYLALSMLAEVTEKESRKQVLDLLGTDSIEALRTQVKTVWENNYCDDGIVTSILASSLWLNQNITYLSSTMDSLAKNYYASSFQGRMGSDEFNQALQNWLNEQTGGLLKEQASGVEMDADTIMALATTIYFKANWSESFGKENTSQEIFYAKDGEITCDFMHQTKMRNYYRGENFSATAQALEGSGNLWLILPDEGVSVEELTTDPQVIEFLFSSEEEKTERNVTLSVPKFDVTSDLDLIPSLKNLGISDVFDSAVSDFSPMTKDEKGIVLSQVKHATRVKIDEEGCVASAYTVMMMARGAAIIEEEEIDFTVNRPFLFVITNMDELPLFVGIVNQP